MDISAKLLKAGVFSHWFWDVSSRRLWIENIVPPTSPVSAIANAAHLATEAHVLALLMLNNS